MIVTGQMEKLRESVVTFELRVLLECAPGMLWTIPWYSLFILYCSVMQSVSSSSGLVGEILSPCSGYVFHGFR
jgi:hypothetical protein